MSRISLLWLLDAAALGAYESMLATDCRRARLVYPSDWVCVVAAGRPFVILFFSGF